MKEGIKMPTKKTIVMLSLGIVFLLGAGGGLAYMLNAQNTNNENDDAPEIVKKSAALPVYVQMDNLVANAKTANGEPRMVQMGLTLVVDNAKTGERVKQFTPSIQHGLLALVSDYTDNELLGREGKERLKKDIANVVRKAIGLPEENTLAEGDGLADNEKVVKAKNNKGPSKEPLRKNKPSPIQDVLFSSFIVQQ